MIDIVVLAVVVAAGALVGILVGRALAPRVGRLADLGDHDGGDDEEPAEGRDG